MRSHCIAYKGYRKSNERKKKHRNSSLIMCAHAAATSYSVSIIIIIHTYSVQRWWRSFAYILCWRYYILPYICIHSSRNPFVYYTRIYHYNGSPRGGWWRVRRPIVMCYIILLYIYIYVHVIIILSASAMPFCFNSKVSSRIHQPPPPPPPPTGNR